MNENPKDNSNSGSPLSRLTHLDLRQLRISDEGAKALAGSPCLTKLERLDLGKGGTDQKEGGK